MESEIKILKEQRIFKKKIIEKMETTKPKI